MELWKLDISEWSWLDTIIQSKLTYTEIEEFGILYYMWVTTY